MKIIRYLKTVISADILISRCGEFISCNLLGCDALNYFSSIPTKCWYLHTRKHNVTIQKITTDTLMDQPGKFETGKLVRSFLTISE